MKKQIFLLMGCAAGLMLMPAKADESQLSKDMDAMNDAYKGFRNETDPAKGAAQAREAQEAVLKTFAQTPEVIQEMPDGPDKAKAVVEYRKMIGKLFLSLCDVEEAFLNGKIDDVAKIVKELREQKTTGHKRFVKDE